METFYLLLSAISVLAVAIGVFVYTYFSDREKNIEYDNCEFDPKRKDRACCNKNKEMAFLSELK